MLFPTRCAPFRPTARLLGAIAGAALLTGAADAQDAAPAAPPVSVSASGANLNISPKRVRFDEAHRSASVYIFNQGTAPATFDISLVDRVMLPDGRIAPVSEAVTAPDQKSFAERVRSAKSMLIAVPRRVTLAPGKGQTIRIRATPEAAQAATESRTHLTVTTVPPRDVGLTAEQAAADGPETLSFSVTSVFGLSIPLIVREGRPDVSARIENVRLLTVQRSADGESAPKPTPVVQLDLVRSGAHSLFGNLEIRGAKGRDPIGAARGLGVYTEIDRRTVQVPLTRAPAKGEALDIRFSDDDATPGRLLASNSLAAP